MKLLFLLLLFCFSAQAQLIQSNLVLYLRADSGITTTNNSLLWQWKDVHNDYNAVNPDSITNVFSQPSTNAMPLYTNDFQGNKCVLFPWAYGAAHPTNYLRTGTLTGPTSTRFTLYTIASISNGEKQTIFHCTNWLFGLCKVGYTGTGAPTEMDVANTATTTLYPPINKVIMAAASGGGGIRFALNQIQEVTAATGSTAISGGEIGGNGVGEYFSGLLYGLLMYNEVHTAAQMGSNINFLAGSFRVQTNYIVKAVCRGDSITAGVGSTNLETWPWQLYEQLPEVMIYNYGLGSLKIGTNGSGDAYTADTTVIDGRFEAGKTNILFLKIGVNDVDATSGAIGYQRLTNYYAARIAAHPWKIIVGTIANNGVAPTAVTNFCNLVRANNNSWWNTNSAVSDSGANSPVEQRLNNATDLNYFLNDGLHLINPGYTVVKEHFEQFLNVPHRGLGFFGQ